MPCLNESGLVPALLEGGDFGVHVRKDGGDGGLLGKRRDRKGESFNVIQEQIRLSPLVYAYRWRRSSRTAALDPTKVMGYSYELTRQIRSGGASTTIGAPGTGANRSSPDASSATTMNVTNTAIADNKGGGVVAA